MSWRTVLFWMHLAAGTVCGVVILIMSVTGVLLMYERQVIAWADRGFRVAPPTQQAQRLGVEELLGRVKGASAITVHSDPAAPVEVSAGRDGAVYLNPYTGVLLGRGSPGVRRFFRVMTDWHRWLGTQGDRRPIGKAITGVSNLAFLFLVTSGMFLWWPRKWTPQGIRAVTLFRGGPSGRARDFNWHNVAGFWCAIPLFFVVLTAVFFSYPWATTALYKMTGTEAPPRPAGPPQQGRRPDQAPPDYRGLNALWARAESQSPEWQSITMRLPATITIDGGHRGRPDKRVTMTFNPATGEIARTESFADYNLGRWLRTWVRWVHTGEAGGVAGQTIAGVVSAGGALLVWTGIALSLRRFRAWLGRRKVKEEELVGVRSR